MLDQNEVMLTLYQNPVTAMSHPRLWVCYSFINGVWKGGKSAQNYIAETAKIFRKDSFITSKTFVTFKKIYLVE